MKVETYKIKNWKKTETGMFISENEDWVLVKHIPVDYVIEGYKLYKKKFIKKRNSGKREKAIERVLTLKEIKQSEPAGFKFGDISEMLKWSEEKYGLFEFQDKKENELFYGKLNSINDDKFIIDMIKSNGKIEKKYDYRFSLNKVRSITFETDYFESISLLMNDELNKK